MKTLFSFILTLLLVSNLSFGQQIEFSQVSNIEMLIANIFGVQCEGVSNVTHSYIVPALGRFENGGIIGVNSGLVLSTGIVANSGLPSVQFSSYGLNAPGDNDINQYGIMNGLPSDSYDAAYVAFDFTPLVTDTISFTYILASEEYPEYSPSQYTDRFMFLVSENGGPNENIAIIPGTTTTVEINSINPYTNQQYYVDNTNPSPFNAANYFIFDGYTVPLTAKFLATVGSTYHIKLVIADVSDGIYDSAIFLEEQESYNDISGGLLVNGTPAEGLLEIFNFVGDTVLAQPVYSVNITNGQYSADSLSTGMYHVRFTPDPVLFPGANPLYFTNGQTWNTAQEVGLPCFLNSATINSNILVGMNGSSSIAGVVIIDTSYTKSVTVPFEGALIKLYNASNAVVDFTYSDEFGMYSFQDVNIGNYHILLDVPYIPQVNIHDIHVGGEQTYVVGADFSILTDGIHADDNLALGIKDIKETTVAVYPNPVKNDLNIILNSKNDFSYSMISMNGAEVISGTIFNGIGTINVSEIEEGIYILQIDGAQHTRISVSKN